MNRKWFKEYGWIYLPVSWQGFLIAALTLVFNIQVFLAVDLRSHSVSDTMYGIFPYAIGSFVILFWAASRTSRRKK